MKIKELVKRIESEISNTPTGELRDLLCDTNITIQTLNMVNIDCTDLDPNFVKALKQLVESQRQSTNE